MRFSLSLPERRTLCSAQRFRESYELARLAESAGFDTATVGHHHFMIEDQVGLQLFHGLSGSVGRAETHSASCRDLSNTIAG